MTTVTLGRGAIVVTDPPVGLKDELTYWKRELGFDKKKHVRTMKGHYENLYTFQKNVLTTLPGFGHRILQYLRKSGTPFSIVDNRSPMPQPNLELACTGLRDYQLEPAINMLMAGGGILSAATGFGKALPNKTRIPTPEGWKTVGDIKPGDFLFGKDGVPVRVVAVHPQPEKKRVWEVVLRDGRSVECCEDHLWNWIERENHGHRWKTDRTADVFRKFTEFKESKRKEYVKIPLCEPIKYEVKELPIDPYVLGASLGNGCLSEQSFTISSGDQFVPEKVAGIIGCTAERQCLRNYSYKFRLPEAKKGKTRSIVWLQTKDIIGCAIPGLMNAKSADKFIPKDYLTASVEQRTALLQGLLDTDGTADSRGRVSYSTTSRRLANDITELVRSLGGIASITIEKRPEKYKSGFCCIVCIAFSPEFKKTIFTHPSKSARVRTGLARGNRNEQNALIRVVDIIETDRYEDMTCFTVDSEDGLFVCGDYVVTHNTRLASAIVRAFDPEALKLRGTPTCVFAAPDKDINRKNWEAFVKLFPDREVGLVMSGVKKFSDDIQVITLDSLHLLNPDEVGLLIVDEVHTAASTSRSEALSRFNKAIRYGVSATPTGRFDGSDLLTEGLFGPVIVQRTYQDAVKLGALVPITVYWLKAPKPHVGLQYYQKYKTRDAKIKSAIVKNPDYSQLVANLMKKIPENKQVLCFTQWVQQMANIHDYCRDIPYVHAQTHEGVGTIGPITPKVRKELYGKVESGEIRKVFATYVFRQGVDFPALDIVVNASGGGSDITAKQIPGRASRKADGKEKAYVIDFLHEWDYEEVNGKRKPGPLMACDLARRRSYKDLGFEQITVESVDDLPFIKESNG